MQLSESKTKKIKQTPMLSPESGREDKCYLGFTNQEKRMKTGHQHFCCLSEP